MSIKKLTKYILSRLNLSTYGNVGKESILEIIDDIKITPVEHADEVLKIALTKELKRVEWVEVEKISKSDDKSQASIQ